MQLTNTPLPAGVSRRSLLRGLGLSALAATLPPAATLTPAADTPVPAPAAATKENVGVYRFGIGDFEATAFSDGSMKAAAPLQPTWAPEAGPGELDAALREAFLPTDQLLLSINVLVVRTPKDLVLIDTGLGTLGGPATGRLRASLAAAGLKPEEFTAVFLTHAHGDHFGGLLDASGKAAFPRAQHFVSAAEWAFWTAPEPDLSRSAVPAETKQGAVAGAQRHLRALEDRFTRVEPGQTPLPDGFEALLAPGHTPGHMPLRIRSGGEELLHIADTAHHPVVMFANPDWTVAYDTDPRGAATSRRRLFAGAATARTRVFGYHLPFPGLGHVRPARANGYEWVPEPWKAAV